MLSSRGIFDVDSDSDLKWFAIKTGFRKEKTVQSNLSKKNIFSFVPLQQVTKQYGRKIKKYQIPIISCYVFVYIDPKNYVTVLDTQFVYQFIKFDNKLAEVKVGELEFLFKLVSSDFPIDVEESNKPHLGEDVEIISGNLTGTKGKLVEYKGKEKVVIFLESVGYSLYLQVDIRLLRKIPALETSM